MLLNILHVRAWLLFLIVIYCINIFQSSLQAEVVPPPGKPRPPRSISGNRVPDDEPERPQGGPENSDDLSAPAGPGDQNKPEGPGGPTGNEGPKSSRWHFYAGGSRTGRSVPETTQPGLDDISSRKKEASEENSRRYPYNHNHGDRFGRSVPEKSQSSEQSVQNDQPAPNEENGLQNGEENKETRGKKVHLHLFTFGK